MNFKSSKLVIISTELPSACLSWAKFPVPVEDILSSLDQLTVSVLLLNYLPFLESGELPIYFSITINPK